MKTKRVVIFIIKDKQGKLIDRISRYIGIATNNQAEYRAIITALEKAINLGATHVELNSDSELVVRLPREQNTEADKLTNAALDLIID